MKQKRVGRPRFERLPNVVPVASLTDETDLVSLIRTIRKAVFDNSRNRRRNFDDVGTEEEIRRPNSSRRFTPSPTRGRSQYVVTDPRRHIAYPVSRQAVGARKTKESDLPRR
ncbi:hypothetical protein TNCV_3425571 [Trichonephila clavipes]|nr:hypothetical protein TNCV_3425571 [Trichonephila clavipes]